ncbi:hypothetical protein [Actinomadura mexicana]|uniref:Uncharacterized protein n=1 Tax=Actinomadura mexicana TaxID=134959 RepID=A0A239HGF3_9ACTN|nr:hypothetical protein [Actinomadura mexicana]SNS80108.1 hypothetical protein SAMN06265355_1312 [Actinomadura mexicana]
MSTAGGRDDGKLQPPPMWWEIADQFKDVEAPDSTPLSDQERAELRKRLNEPGRQRGLTSREQAARWEMGIIRPGPAVEELYQEVKRSLDAPSTSPTSRLFGRGILAAIEFATGVQPTAPVSGEPAEENPPPVGQLSREEERAADIAAGHVRAQVSRDYATGVEHTIMWLLARTDTRPWGRLR